MTTRSTRSVKSMRDKMTDGDVYVVSVQIKGMDYDVFG
jgi:hypothetical protein